MVEKMISGGGYKGWRRGILALAVAAALLPSPASACLPCTLIAPAAAATASIATLNGLLLIYRLAVVDALAGAAEEIKGTIIAHMTLQKEVQEVAAKQDAFSKTELASKNLGVNNIPNTQDMVCQMQTASLSRNVADDYAAAIRRGLEESIAELGTRQDVGPTRLAIGWIYRLCKSGQLRRGTAAANYSDSDFGPTWFDANRCVNDPVQAHAFLRPSTILDHPVLLPPSKEQMETLNNPATYDPADGGAPIVGTPAQVWAGLLDKQKHFVSAKLFCDNLIMSRIHPVGLSRDQMLAAGNQANFFTNLGEMGKLQSAYRVCAAELARRTAIDTDLFPDPLGAIQALAVSGLTYATFMLEVVGRNPAEIHAYRTDPATGENLPGTEPRYVCCGDYVGFKKNFISPYVKERAIFDYCNVPGTASDAALRNGTEAQATAGNLQCVKLQQAWQLREVESRTAFVQVVQKVAEVEGYVPVEATPVHKTRFKGRDGTSLKKSRRVAIDKAEAEAIPAAYSLQDTPPISEGAAR